MKKVKRISTLLVGSIIFLTISAAHYSCSKEKDDDKEPFNCKTCVDVPDALPENDNSAKGVYKGVEVGSTGTITIDIQNGSNTIKATMVLDGITANLISNVTYIDGEPYVAPFTGTYDGNPVSITFSVAVGGGAPTVISSDIPGHEDAVFTVAKETSTSLIEAFEGTFSKSGETGTFNILLSRSLNIWGGVAKSDLPNSEVDHINGTISGNKLLETDSGYEVGTLNGDELNGQFQDDENNTITVTGYRTL